MPWVLRFARLLCVGLWLGGLVFFAFAVAPVAFSRLASAHEAGVVVGGTLRVLHLLGLGCGILFLVLTLAVVGRVRLRRVWTAEIVLDVVMLSVTAYSQFLVLPAMEVDRAEAGGDVAVAETTNGARVDFEKLHRLSERLEGAVLLGGLGLLFLVANDAVLSARTARMAEA